MKKTTVGIIGFGSFGEFMAKSLSKHCRVKVYSTSGHKNKWASLLEEVAACDYILPTIPLDAYQSVLTELKPLIRPETVIVDICSVKVEPLKLIKKILPKQPVVATHPLFGPQSTKDGLKGHVIVLCPEASDPKQLKLVQEFSKKLGLKVELLSAEEHDQEMATIHGLTFFVAHALKDMGLQRQKLATPSFKKLYALAELEQNHTDDLFLTIQTGNPYTKKVREEFVKNAERLSQQINQASK
jgi:prephenate dehydrogenase